MSKEVEFKTEAELCAAFIAWVKQCCPGWICYAETEGWDILVAHDDGTQIGVQAKMRLSLEVLAQCVEDGQWAGGGVGPDFRVVLVPKSNAGEKLAHAIGITVICRDTHWSTRHDKAFTPDLNLNVWQHWHYRNPQKRHDLPRFVPDVPAGVPSPSPLTKWKIAALQICAVLELRGYVTRRDFSLAGIDHRRWVEAWLDTVDGKPGAWKLRAGAPDFRVNHPTVYPQVLAEVREKGLANELRPLL